jgi:hypothetical protein
MLMLFLSPLTTKPLEKNCSTCLRSVGGVIPDRSISIKVEACYLIFDNMSIKIKNSLKNNTTYQQTLTGISVFCILFGTTFPFPDMKEPVVYLFKYLK